MNARLAAQVLSAAVLAAVAWTAAKAIPALTTTAGWIALVAALVGALVAWRILATPIDRVETYLREAPVEDLFVAVLGLALGLVVGVLLSIPLVLLGPPMGNLLPIAVTLVAALVSLRVALLRQGDLHTLLRSRRDSLAATPELHAGHAQVLLDTSAIIDGRIADISATGFISGEMIIPRFVLDELQHIADSPDVLRRNRGRRGLDMLNRMNKEADAVINILDIDPREVRDVHEVDSKLVHIARKLSAPIITNDYNLNKVAQIQGVRVLNVNELANAVKPVVLPNEEMVVKVIQIGKEIGQGVGYLDDGTMIVVEDGARHIDEDVDIVVTRVLQTVAGRMIFAAIKGHSSRGYNGGRPH